MPPPLDDNSRHHRSLLRCIDRSLLLHTLRQMLVGSINLYQEHKSKRNLLRKRNCCDPLDDEATVKYCTTKIRPQKNARPRLPWQSASTKFLETLRIRSNPDGTDSYQTKWPLDRFPLFAWYIISICR